jgi:hypothetical protein
MHDLPEQLALWQTLSLESSLDLLRDAAVCNPSDVAAVSRLRQNQDADLVHLALDLIKARNKAASKWPAQMASNLFADSVGIEQATSLCVSEHKAKRFVALGKPVLDLCCGIGGDAIGMQRAGVTVTGIDLDPIRAWMTAQNAGCPTQVMDVSALTISRDTVFHIDPSRRNQYGRTHNLSDYQPGLEVLEQLLAQQPTACFKLGPGVDLDELPSGEIEIISENGHLVQAVLWTGELAQCARRATLLPQGLQIVAEEDDVWEEPPTDAIGPYVMTFDASVERPGLIACLCRELDVACVHPQAGLLTADEPVDSPWVTNFEVLAELPWQIKQVKAALRKHDAGIVEVKTRGKLVNPDPLQKQLRGKGNQLLTVFVLKLGDHNRAIITRRIK